MSTEARSNCATSPVSSSSSSGGSVPPSTAPKPDRHQQQQQQQQPACPRSHPAAEARLASPEDTALTGVSSLQLQILEDNFKRDKNMDAITLEIVAAEAGLSTEETARWFQHKRALWRQNEGLNPNSRTLEEFE